MIKLLIFDWDGTIVDSVEKILTCKKFLARKYGLPEPSEEIVRSVLGTKFEDALAKCFPTASKNTLDQLGKDFHLLMQMNEYQARLFPNAKDVLMQLKQAGIKLAVATSKNREELNKSLEYNSLTEIFIITCCGKEHQEKPHPAMIDYILENTQTSRQDCLVVGDTTTDIIFSHNASVEIICVTFGAHSKYTLQAEKPKAFISSWLKLPGIVLNYDNQF